MALLDTHSDKNKIQLVEELEWIEKELIFGNWEKFSYVDSIVVQSWRTMTKWTKRKRQSFQYVGMTREAAQACKEDMIDKYTKKIPLSQWNAQDGVWEKKDGGELLMAEVNCIWTAGDMWQVDVDVNEVYEQTSKEGQGVNW